MGGLIDLLVWSCVLGGGLFSVIGGVGLLRMPDFYTRTHAAGLTDTMGATLILLGLAIHHASVSGLDLVVAKLVIILLFLYLTSPTAGHALVKAAYSQGVEALVVDGSTNEPASARNGAPDPTSGGGEA